MKLSLLINKETLPKNAYYESDIFNKLYGGIHFHDKAGTIFSIMNREDYTRYSIEIINHLLNNMSLYFGDDINKFIFNNLDFQKLHIASLPSKVEIPEKLKISIVSQFICYLIRENKICNPFYEKKDANEITQCIDFLLDKNTQEKSPEKKMENIIVGGRPGKYLYNLTRYYTDQERYNTTILKSKKTFKVTDLINNNDCAMQLYDIVKTAMFRLNSSSQLTSHNIIASAYEHNYIAGNFNPIALYEVINYINDSATKEKFSTPLPPFKNFYDPCGGWGERMTAAYLAHYPAQFSNIVINDLNKNLENPYQEIVSKLKPKASPKNIYFTYQDALKKENTIKMDLIFTGLPFFNSEQYNNCNLDQYNNDYTNWMSNWCIPLIKKLVINDLKPGGILAFNLGSTRIGIKNEQNLPDLLLNDLYNKEPHDDFRRALSIPSQNKDNHNNVVYGSDGYSKMVFFQKNNTDMIIQNPPFKLDHPAPFLNSGLNVLKKKRKKENELEGHVVEQYTFFQSNTNQQVSQNQDKSLQNSCLLESVHLTVSPQSLPKSQ